MFIDSSAFMAILLDEPDASDLLARLVGQKQKPLTSTVVRYEVVVSLARSRSAGSPVSVADIDLATERFDELLTLLDCTELAVSVEAGRLACQVAAIYGKVAGHKAQLNMGDCLSYAMAKAHQVPLLYKGRDFAETDLA